MKTITQFALTGLATALFASGSAFAGDGEWRTIDNHHGSVTYYAPRSVQKTVTVGFFNGRTGQGLGRTNTVTRQDQGGFRQVTTPHGTVSYYAPAE